MAMLVVRHASLMLFVQEEKSGENRLAGLKEIPTRPKLKKSSTSLANEDLA
jgi:hypothetical protein